MESKDLQPVEGDELPLASRDSQPPLVVDLPDGQKLVVGDLDPGTVIEIATWRGTGRPDSRTNRFMLGVSTTEAEGIPSKRSLPKPETFEQQKQVEQNAQIEYASISAPAAGSITQLGNKEVSTGLVYANVNPNTRINEVEKAGSYIRKSKLIRKVIFYTSSIASVAALIFVLLGPMGLKFAHPVAGAGTALGSADSSIIAVQAKEAYEVGESVVSDLPSNLPSPIVGIVAAVSDRAILLSTENGYVQVRTNQVHGKAVAVLPFIGQIASLIGQ